MRLLCPSRAIGLVPLGKRLWEPSATTRSAPTSVRRHCARRVYTRARETFEVVLIDCISVGVDRMQRNFEPMRKQVEAWQRSELTDVTAKVIIYEAFVEGKLEAPKHLARTVHDLYFRTEVRGVQTANNLEPLQRVHFRIQGTGSPSHSSRPRPNWVNSWKPASHARSSSWAVSGGRPCTDTPALDCAASVITLPPVAGIAAQRLRATNLWAAGFLYLRYPSREKSHDEAYSCFGFGSLAFLPLPARCGADCLH